ncbi:MAG: ATP-grasp domain-containing protein [Verrucomicrobia bacterium]|nr:ATP-grasp domain-containing protein [Verrucomicrobiota bacterium]MDA1087083.1 ATP-grasp domain-containing protein [Verrucomicrobiota bacterium]
MKKPLHVTVLMDWAAIPDEDPDFRTPPKGSTTEYDVVAALRKLKHDVSVVAAHQDPAQLLSDLGDRKPDLVFNLTESFRDNRDYDKNITALLEMTGIPFTGTGTVGLMLCRDKGLSKQLLAHHRVRIPGFLILPSGKRVHVPARLQYPMVVKPMLADGSEGIANSSLVEDEESLRERVQFVHDRWSQPAIVEEYIGGRELYVGILGNSRLQVLPPRELFFRSDSDDGPVLATYRLKWDEAYRKKWEVTFGFAQLEDVVSKRVARICRKVYHVLQLRDYGRIDLRLTPDDRIVVLEVNPNPDIAKDDEVAQSARKNGITYTALVDRIVRMTMRRSEAG